MEVLATSHRSETPVSDREGMFAHLVANRLVPTPEVPSDTIGLMVDACLVAVSHAREGRLEEVVTLPERVTHNGVPTAQVHEIVDAFDLEDWLY